MIATLLTALTLGLSFGPSTPTIQPGPSTIRISDKQVSIKKLSGHLHLGTIKVEQYLLYNKHVSDDSIGNYVSFCTFLGTGGVLGSGQWFCRNTIRLPKGTLIAAGVVGVHSLFYSLAVVGGTGAYANVNAGDLVSSITATDPRRDNLIFQLWAS